MLDKALGKFTLMMKKLIKYFGKNKTLAYYVPIQNIPSIDFAIRDKIKK